MGEIFAVWFCRLSSLTLCVSDDDCPPSFSVSFLSALPLVYSYFFFFFSLSLSLSLSLALALSLSLSFHPLSCSSLAKFWFPHSAFEQLPRSTAPTSSCSTLCSTAWAFFLPFPFPAYDGFTIGRWVLLFLGGLGSCSCVSGCPFSPPPQPLLRGIHCSLAYPPAANFTKLIP